MNYHVSVTLLSQQFRYSLFFIYSVTTIMLNVWLRSIYPSTLTLCLEFSRHLIPWLDIKLAVLISKWQVSDCSLNDNQINSQGDFLCSNPILQAYEECSDVNEAEALLKDIVVSFRLRGVANGRAEFQICSLGKPERAPH